MGLKFWGPGSILGHLWPYFRIVCAETATCVLLVINSEIAIMSQQSYDVLHWPLVGLSDIIVYGQIVVCACAKSRRPKL